MAGAAVETTRKALALYGPSVLRSSYYDGNARQWLPRLQGPPGPQKAATDPHAAGRALDIILFASDSEERDFADRIVTIFLDLRARMGFTAVIYNYWEWNGAGYKFARKGDPHTTHIHIEWSSAGVNNASFEFHLMYALWEEFWS